MSLYAKRGVSAQKEEVHAAIQKLDQGLYPHAFCKMYPDYLMGDDAFGINRATIVRIVGEVSEVINLGVEVAIVIGGGNIFRGVAGASNGMDRVQGDYMGMLATVINGMALQGALEDKGMKTRLQTALKMESIAEPYIKRRAVRHLEKGRIVIFGAGTGNPFFTTDTAASLRAIEIEADVILKGTRVDGIYTADPEKDPNATKYERVSFNEVYEKGLNVMDMTAFTLCNENKLPIIVFDMDTPGNLRKLMEGAPVGTLVSAS